MISDRAVESILNLQRDGWRNLGTSGSGLEYVFELGSETRLVNLATGEIRQKLSVGTCESMTGVGRLTTGQ